MCDLDATGASSTLRVILSTGDLSRMLPTLDRNCEEKVPRLKWNSPLVDYDSRTPESKVPDPSRSRGNSRDRCPHIVDPGSEPPVYVYYESLKGELKTNLYMNFGVMKD